MMIFDGKIKQRHHWLASMLANTMGLHYLLMGIHKYISLGFVKKRLEDVQPQFAYNQSVSALRHY
jgi:hypothetical protein